MLGSLLNILCSILILYLVCSFVYRNKLIGGFLIFCIIAINTPENLLNGIKHIYQYSILWLIGIYVLLAFLSASNSDAQQRHNKAMQEEAKRIDDYRRITGQR